MTTTLNNFKTENTNMDHSKKIKIVTGNEPLSPFAHFSAVFRGYSFFDYNTNRTLTKTQVYFRDPILALGMAATGMVDKRYKLVDTLGWTNGTLNS